MSKKINVWGSKLPYTTVQINKSAPGTTNYNDLTNKPQLNGQELVGNTDLNNTYYTKQDINNSFYTKSNMSTLYYDKDTIDSKISELNIRINILESTLTALINQKTSAQEHYLKNKAQLVEGQNMTLTMNDNEQTISFNATDVPEPSEPTADGIYSFDSIKRIYRKYNEATIFAATGDIEYCEGNQYNNFPSTYDKKIARQIFNEPIFFIFKDVDETTINNLFKICLGNCIEFNYPLDFSEVSNLTYIGQGFLIGCIKFNSPITFNNKIISIGDDFMYGCTKFNNQFYNLFSPSLQEIRKNFLMGCQDFNQNIDLSNVTCDGTIGNKIMLINFMCMCYNFSQGKIILGNKTTNIFKQSGYNPNMFEGMLDSFSTLNNASAPSYQVGFHFEGNNISKSILDSFVISTSNGNTVNVFQNNNEQPYRKIVVNGVNE